MKFDRLLKDAEYTVCFIKKDMSSGIGGCYSVVVKNQSLRLKYRSISPPPYPNYLFLLNIDQKSEL